LQTDNGLISIKPKHVAAMFVTMESFVHYTALFGSLTIHYYM